MECADLGFSNDIARSGGIIMDRCTRGDNTVSGTAYLPIMDYMTL